MELAEIIEREFAPLLNVSRDILADLESGYIANHSRSGDLRRNKYEKTLREILQVTLKPASEG